MSYLNRTEFLKSIQTDLFKDMINNHFDESMAFYDLISDKIKVDNVLIGHLSNENQNDNMGIIFYIDAKSNKEANNIESIVKRYSVSCYDHNYSVETEVNKSKLHIKFKEVSG